MHHTVPVLSLLLLSWFWCSSRLFFVPVNFTPLFSKLCLASCWQIQAGKCHDGLGFSPWMLFLRLSPGPVKSLMSSSVVLIPSDTCKWWNTYLLSFSWTTGTQKQWQDTERGENYNYTTFITNTKCRGSQQTWTVWNYSWCYLFIHSFYQINLKFVSQFVTFIGQYRHHLALWARYMAHHGLTTPYYGLH